MPIYRYKNKLIRLRAQPKIAKANPVQDQLPYFLGAAAVAVGSVGAYYYVKGLSTGTTGSTGSCMNNSNCVVGDVCINGQCVSTGSTGSSGCTSNTQCGPCQHCIGGQCGNQIPTSIVQTTNLTGLQQGECVLTFYAIACYWDTLAFGSNCMGSANVWTATGKVVDQNGVGVPCIIPTAQSTNTAIVIWDEPSETDPDGNFSFTFGLESPQQGGAACPFYGMPSNGSVSGVFNVGLPDTDYMVPFGVIIIPVITGT